MDLLTRLQKRGELSMHAVTMLKAFKARWSVDCFNALLECKVYSEGRMAELIATEYSYSCIDSLNADLIDLNVSSHLPYHVARRYSAIAAKGDDQGRIHCVFANPSDELAVRTVSSYFKKPIHILVAQRTDIQVLISDIYTPEAMLNSQDL